MKYEVNSVKEYLAAIPAERKPQLEQLISIVKELAPDAEEELNYGMPFYPLEGPLFAIASQKHFMALYVTEHDIVKKYKDELGKVSMGKSCIRFKHIYKINLDVVRQIIEEVYERRKSGIPFVSGK